ncbi:hypothetical protein GCM10010286_27400 [Streptomyces toxytricini]|nr:hypothetical protein GCM10010286_27400 [Streptomyces toxytricini]
MREVGEGLDAVVDLRLEDERVDPVRGHVADVEGLHVGAHGAQGGAGRGEVRLFAGQGGHGAGRGDCGRGGGGDGGLGDGGLGGVRGHGRASSCWSAGFGCDSGAMRMPAGFRAAGALPDGAAGGGGSGDCNQRPAVTRTEFAVRKGPRRVTPYGSPTSECQTCGWGRRSGMGRQEEAGPRAVQPRERCAPGPCERTMET